MRPVAELPAAVLPVVELGGSCREQGLAHGRLLADRVHHNLAVYFDRFEREAALPPAEVLARVARYWPLIEARHPEYAAGVAGLAEGAGAEMAGVAALNLRYEILYHQFSALAQATGRAVDGCTSFALLPPRGADGHLFMGQNWDWIPEVQGAVLRVTEPGLPRQLCFTEAGIFGGKIGLNAAGVGLAINGLTSTEDDWTRLGAPVHVRTWQALRASRLEDARDAILAEPRGCSVHLLIAQAGATDRAWGLETAPSATRSLAPSEDGVYSHANHFEDEAAIGVRQPPSPFQPHSVHRAARCRAIMAGGDGPLGPDDLMARLRDHDGHPNSVCRHPDPARGEASYHTVTSVLMDLTAGRMWVTDGPPCASDYQELALAEHAR